MIRYHGVLAPNARLRSQVVLSHEPRSLADASPAELCEANQLGMFGGEDAIEAHLMEKWGVWPGPEGPPAIFDDLVLAGASLGSCGPPCVPSDVAACVAGQTPRSASVRDSLLGGPRESDCARAAACIGLAAVETNEGETRCEGALDVAFSGNYEVMADCANALTSVKTALRPLPSASRRGAVPKAWRTLEPSARGPRRL